MSETCQLKEAPFYQCCCNCRHHLKDNFHCTIHTELRKSSGDNCVCSFRKGWICVGMVFEDPENGRAHSEWPEHSVGCEMYAPIKIYLRATEGGCLNTVGHGGLSEARLTGMRSLKDSAITHRQAFADREARGDLAAYEF